MMEKYAALGGMVLRWADEFRQRRKLAARIRRRAKSKGLVANKSRHKRPDWFIHSGEQMIYCAQSDLEALAFLEEV